MNHAFESFEERKIAANTIDAAEVRHSPAIR